LHSADFVDHDVAKIGGLPQEAEAASEKRRKTDVPKKAAAYRSELAAQSRYPMAL
jgi:hypothetical protein